MAGSVGARVHPKQLGLGGQAGGRNTEVMIWGIQQIEKKVRNAEIKIKLSSLLISLRKEIAQCSPWAHSVCCLFYKCDFIGTQPHPCIYVLSMAVLAQRQQNRVVATETVQPTKSVSHYLALSRKS